MISNMKGKWESSNEWRKRTCVPDRDDNRCAVRANGIMAEALGGISSFTDLSLLVPNTFMVPRFHSYPALVNFLSAS